MPKPRIGILVVAYNAENHLRQTLERIPRDLRGKIEEVFVFDDASRDQTHAVGRKVQETWEGTRLSIFRNPSNLMYGGNQRRGYEYAIERGLDIVVLLHGDGQYAPEVMQRLLDPLERGAADAVMGSRMMIRGEALKGNMPAYKYYGNRILTGIENALIGAHLSEFHSGYRAYSVEALRRLPLASLTRNWHFDTQILLELLKQRLRIAEVPIPTYYGDEICHVNGIPYAMHCVGSALHFALFHRWRPARPAQPNRSWSSHAALPAAPGSAEHAPTDFSAASPAAAKGNS